MDPNRKRDAADRADLAGSVTAGTVGAGFGAAKLRDSYREEHGAKFGDALTRVHHGLQAHGVSPKNATKVTRFAATAKPKFAHLAVATGAGVVAAGAGHYSSHIQRSQARAARRERDAAARAKEAKDPVAKSAFGVIHPDVLAKAKQPGTPGAAKVGFTGTTKPAKVKGAKKAAKAAAAATPDPVVETPKAGKRLRAAKASPSMPKAEEIFDQVRGALKPAGALQRHAPTAAVLAAGLTAGALIHRAHKDDLHKSAFGVVHPEIEKGLRDYIGPKGSKGPKLKAAAKGAARSMGIPTNSWEAGKLTAKAGKMAAGHGKYIAGAAGVSGAGAIGAVLANRARKAAPAAIDRKVAAKLPMPKAGTAIALGAAGLGTAAVLARRRRANETLHKSAFGVEHPLPRAG